MDLDQGGDTADAVSSCNIDDNDYDYEGDGDYNGGDGLRRDLNIVGAISHCT